MFVTLRQKANLSTTTYRNWVKDDLLGGLKADEDGCAPLPKEFPPPKLTVPSWTRDPKVVAGREANEENAEAFVGIAEKEAFADKL